MYRRCWQAGVGWCAPNSTRSGSATLRARRSRSDAPRDVHKPCVRRCRLCLKAADACVPCGQCHRGVLSESPLCWAGVGAPCGVARLFERVAASGQSRRLPQGVHRPLSGPAAAAARLSSNSRPHLSISVSLSLSLTAPTSGASALAAISSARLHHGLTRARTDAQAPLGIVGREPPSLHARAPAGGKLRTRLPLARLLLAGSCW